MVDTYRGKEIPANAEQVKWDNGLVTCLPWTVGAQGEIWVCDVSRILILCSSCYVGQECGYAHGNGS